MQRILIANRGEIASRIIKTCKRLGIETVAVYSDADSEMPYVKEADQSFRIGEPPVNKSYLNMEKLLDIAKQEKVDGIHPGYGLLSENSIFAKKCEEEGFIFIGPSQETIEKMGDKIKAIETMREAGIPVLPGGKKALASLEDAIREAEIVGYPVMLKASGGGGGIGMGRCENEQALTQLYESTKKRAKAYFGNDDLFIEKYIDNAKHIEIQVFGDQFGNILHLFERNCSVQRRNQKVIEEAASPALSDAVRESMYAAAVAAAKAVHYKNAGTVEFIVDEHDHFYFLEMNTRLQVEHPVTEAVTGIDLVEWQIAAAKGEKLPLLQADIRLNGHAIEFRIYAEDPVTYYPSPGKMITFYLPEGNARIDTGYSEGNTVSPFYDPMIAKCIFHGPNREECINKAKAYLEKIQIEGIKTNIPYLLDILENDEFISGHYDTNILAKKN